MVELIAELPAGHMTETEVVMVVVMMVVLVVVVVVELVTELVTNSQQLSSREQEQERVLGLAEHQLSPPKEQIRVQGRARFGLPLLWEPV